MRKRVSKPTAKRREIFTHMGQYEWILGSFISFLTLARNTSSSGLVHPSTRVYTAALRPSSPELMFSYVHVPRGR